MKHLLEKYLPLRNADGGGAGGGAGGAGGDGNAGGAGGAGGGNGGGNAAGGGAGAGGADAGAGATAPYRPQGVAETLFGDDDKGTIDKMVTALNGYRTRDAERGVPENVEAYNFDAAKLTTDLKLDAKVTPYLAELGKDPLYKAVSDVAFAEKVPPATLNKLVGTLYAEAVKTGIMEPLVDAAAERAKLLPEAAKNLPKDKQDAAIEARMQANEDWIKLLTKPGADGKAQLDKAVGDHVLMMLADRAEGHQFLEFMRNSMTGGDRANPLGGGGGQSATGQSQREQLRERAQAPEVTPGHRLFDQKKWVALQEDYKRLIGDK